MDIDQKRAQTFNQIAQLYDAARPSYPAELIEDVISLAQLSADAKILEIGTGTAKATLPFAQRGYTLHGLEPGNQLATVAAANLRPYPKVTIETVTFEDWSLQPATYDLVMSAQAFHWIDPEVGYPKIAQALKPEGSVALIWNIAVETDTAIAQQLDEIYADYADWRITPFEQRQKEREQALIASQCFAQPAIKRYFWSQRYTTQQYLDLTSTQSDYLVQPKAKQRGLLDAIAIAINNSGGFIVRPYVSVLLLSKKI